MKSLFLCLALAVAEFETEESVIVGSADNFDAILEASKYVLVEFYAPWCGHCKSLAPEYAKAAQELEEAGSEIKLVKVDATIHGELAKEFGVGGYPTLKWFKGSDRKAPVDYKGGRKHPEIVSWLKKKSGPPVIAIDGADAATKFAADNEVAVVGFNADAAVFEGAGDAFDEVPFGVLDADAAAALEVADGKIALLKHFDDKRADFDGATKDELVAFVNMEQLALVNEFSDKTAPKIFGGDIKQHNLLFAAKSAADYDTVATAYGEAAKAFKGKILFVLVDCDVDDNKRVMEFFGITEEGCPDMRVINMEQNMAKYAPEKADLSTEGITAFVNGVLDGSIQRHLKSEEIPEQEPGVQIIVGKNFDSIAYNEEKDVLVEFYAPWCGHCKALTPIWDELGEKYKDHASIVIAKSDATANEFADVEVQGFPTIKFFPKGEKKMVDYNGGRTLDDFVKFLEPDAAADEPEAEADVPEEDVKDEL
jgi:protein disulfide-isomerase A1